MAPRKSGPSHVFYKAFGLRPLIATLENNITVHAPYFVFRVSDANFVILLSIWKERCIQCIKILIIAALSTPKWFDFMVF